MQSLADVPVAWGFPGYDARWEAVAAEGRRRSVALDVRLAGQRYLSLTALALTPSEAASLARLTERFARLIDHATRAILEDSAWWPDLAWPWPAIELARQEPLSPAGCTLYGRFDWLLDISGEWKLIEFNADTPSGGREVAGLQPAALHLYRHEGVTPVPGGSRLALRLRTIVVRRLEAFERETGQGIRRVGVVSSHDWLEDMAQAWWLAGLLASAGRDALVGDVRDLAVVGGRVLLRGEPIQALYRFYPIERLYRHGVFAPLLEAAIDQRLLLLNGLHGFLAQSKAILAWLWQHRHDPALGPDACSVIERHLPATLLARNADAATLLPRAMLKHVNGREGEEVTPGDAVDSAKWQSALVEGGYVVQERVTMLPVDTVDVDEDAQELRRVGPRFPCFGAFSVGGRFAGCYTRLGGPITRAGSAFVPTGMRSLQAARQ